MHAQDRDEAPQVTTPKANLNRPSLILGISLCLQALAVAAVLCLPFGFDHPSSWGLDFGHYMFIHLVYFVALVIGMITSIMDQRWVLLAIQLAVVLVGGWLFFI